MRPPAVIIHGLADAKMALAQGWPVTLLSAPGAAIYGGVGWWRGLIEAVGPAWPDILDCGAAAGRALEALRGGQRILVLRASGPIFAEVGALADASRATILAHPPAGLDLADPRAARRLGAWLNGDGKALD